MGTASELVKAAWKIMISERLAEVQTELKRVCEDKTKLCNSTKKFPDHDSACLDRIYSTVPSTDV